MLHLNATPRLPTRPQAVRAALLEPARSHTARTTHATAHQFSCDASPSPQKQGHARAMRASAKTGHQRMADIGGQRQQGPGRPPLPRTSGSLRRQLTSSNCSPANSPARSPSRANNSKDRVATSVGQGAPITAGQGHAHRAGIKPARQCYGPADRRPKGADTSGASISPPGAGTQQRAQRADHIPRAGHIDPGQLALQWLSRLPAGVASDIDCVMAGAAGDDGRRRRQTTRVCDGTLPSGELG